MELSGRSNKFFPSSTCFCPASADKSFLHQSCAEFSVDDQKCSPYKYRSDEFKDELFSNRALNEFAKKIGEIPKNSIEKKCEIDGISFYIINERLCYILIMKCSDSLFYKELRPSRSSGNRYAFYIGARVISVVHEIKYCCIRDNHFSIFPVSEFQSPKLHIRMLAFSLSKLFVLIRPGLTESSTLLWNFHAVA
jgi:hypothetical protein